MVLLIRLFMVGIVRKGHCYVKRGVKPRSGPDAGLLMVNGLIAIPLPYALGSSDKVSRISRFAGVSKDQGGGGPLRNSPVVLPEKFRFVVCESLTFPYLLAAKIFPPTGFRKARFSSKVGVGDYRPQARVDPVAYLVFVVPE